MCWLGGGHGEQAVYPLGARAHPGCPSAQSTHTQRDAGADAGAGRLVTYSGTLQTGCETFGNLKLPVMDAFTRKTGRNQKPKTRDFLLLPHADSSPLC